MKITVGRGNAAKSLTVGTGYLFRRRPKEERTAAVSMFCSLAGIKVTG